MNEELKLAPSTTIEHWHSSKVLNVIWKLKKKGSAEKTIEGYSKRLHEPELKRIRLYDLRHYFATMLYHRTKDVLFVKRQLGHRRLENTLIYTHLIDFKDDEYVVRVARSVQEACQLVESGFEYVTEMEGIKIFRKRK